MSKCPWQSDDGTCGTPDCHEFQQGPSNCNRPDKEVVATDPCQSCHATKFTPACLSIPNRLCPVTSQLQWIGGAR